MVIWTSEPVPEDETTLLKIGEVAERVGLSLRTIRYYEEEGLVVPDSRTEGGFRLYSRTAVDRLELIKRMKPLGFSVEEMVEVLSALDTLTDPETGRAERIALAEQLDTYRDRVETKAVELLATAARGREFGQHLREVADLNR
jgi:DNA-binding transcriptional MerR regulator